MPDFQSESKHIASLDLDISQIPKQLEQIEQMLKSAGKNIEDLFGKIVPPAAGLGGDALPAVNRLLNSEKDIMRVYEQSAKLQLDIRNNKQLTNAVSEQELTHVRTAAQALFEQYQASGNVTTEMKQQTAELQKQLSVMNTQAKVSAYDNPVVNNKSMLSEVASKAKWYLAGSAAFAGGYAAKEALQTLTDVEFKVMEITRVMNDSTLNVQSFQSELFNLAVQYGTSFEDVSNIAKTFAQANYNAKETIDMTKDSLLALNTAELDVKNSTESMIGILQQWGFSADNLSTVIDRINYTADNSALASQDLVDGLLQASEVAKTANMSFDETVGVLTALKEASGRSGKEVGNAFKSVLTYIQRPKSLEGFDEMGIDVYADRATKTLLPMMQILQNMAAKWNDMESATKEAFMKSADDAGLFSEELAIAVGAQDEYAKANEAMTAASDKANDAETRKQASMAAGVYRLNYYIALMGNMDRAIEVTNDLQNANGYSMQENGRTMETLEKKYNSFIAALQNLAVEAGNGGFIGLAKGALDLATGLAQISSNALSVPLLLAAIVMTMSLLNKETKLFGTYSIQAWSDIGPSLKNALSDLKAYATGQKLARDTTVGTTLAVTALNAAITFGLAAAIEGIVLIFQKWDESVKAAKADTIELGERVKAIETSFKNAEKASIEYKDSMNAQALLLDTYEKRIETLMESENRSAASKRLLLDTIKEMNSILPDINLAYDAETDSLNRSTEARRDNIQAFKDQIVAKAQEKLLVGRADTKAEADSVLAGIETQISVKRKELTEAENALISAQPNQKLGKEQDIRFIRSELEDLAKDYNAAKIKAQEADDAFNSLADKLLKGTSGAAPQINDATAAIQKFTQSASDTKYSADDFNSGMELIDAAAQRVSQGLTLNADEVFNLITRYPELAGQVKMAADGYTFEAEALNQVRVAEINKAMAQQMGIAVSQFAQTATQEQKAKLAELLTALDGATTAEARLTAQTALYMFMASNAQGATGGLANALNSIKALIGAVNSIGSSGSGGGGESWAQKRIKALQKETKTIQDEYQKQIEAQRKASQAMVEDYNKQIEAVKKAADARIKALRDVKEERDRNRERADLKEDIDYWSKRTGVEAFDNLKDAKKKLNEKEADWSLDDQIQAIEDARDAEVERLEAIRDAEKERYEAEIERLQALKDKEQEKSSKEIEALQKIANTLGGIDQNLDELAKKEAENAAKQKTNADNVYSSWFNAYWMAKLAADEAQRLANAGSWSEKTRIFNERQEQFKVPQSHTGSLVSKEGLVNVAPGEIIIRPDITANLIQMLGDYKRAVSGGTTNNFFNTNSQTDNGKSVAITINGPLSNVEHQEIADKADVKLANNGIIRQLTRAVNLKKPF
jgi:TP901 family phage tail tape measure protein